MVFDVYVFVARTTTSKHYHLRSLEIQSILKRIGNISLLLGLTI
jgi:hypothetical protein